MNFYEHTKILLVLQRNHLLCLIIIINMEKYTILDTNAWKRKSTFEFFKTFDIPFYNITANVEVTKLKSYCKRNNYSFFLVCLFLSQKTISKIENFHYRLVDDKVRKYETTQAGSTILLENETFSFCYFDVEPNLEDFIKKGEESITALKKDPDFRPREGELNMVFYSTIPWVSFTSFQHARRFDENDSIPRIVFGKYFDDSHGNTHMPVSVEVHHSLVDGLHVGKYFETLQKEIDSLD